MSTIIPYFNLCYGEKFMAGAKLSFIRSLMLSGGDAALSLAISVAYSLAESGTARKISLSQQLLDLGLLPPLLPIPTFADNFNLPSLFFLIGL